MDPREIKKRFETLYSERKVVEEQWQTIEQFVAPYKGKFFKEQQGESGIEWRESRNIYDATAVQAHIQLASSIHGALTNPAVMWFDMQWRDLDLRKNYQARVWMERAAKRVYDELQDSNFNLEANNCYRGLTSFATAAVIEEPNADITDEWKGITFTHVPIKQCYFEPDANGQCRNFYRLLRWRASRIVDKFGLDNVPDTVKAKYESATDDEIEVIYCCYTRTDKQDQTDTILTPDNRPYGFTYILRADATVLDTGGYYEMPAFMVRWEITDESMWGNGPAHYALADILTLNTLVELDLKSREKVIDPANLIQERALMTDLDLSPGAQNVVRDVTQIRPYESAARFDAVESSIVRLQQAVRKYFYIDQLELKDSPAMTATEVAARMELMQRMLASTMARLKEDFLNPLLTRTFNLLYRAGEFDDLPDGVELTDYDITYIGPLSRSMKFDQAASVERWITQLQLIAQMGGEAEKVMLVPNFDAIARYAADNLNLPTELTRSADEVEEDYNERKGMAQRQASAEAAANEAAAAKDLSQAETLRGGEQSIVAG
jgi:hypothetical protein